MTLKDGLSPHDHCPGQSRLPWNHRRARAPGGSRKVMQVCSTSGLGAGKAVSLLQGSCVLLPPSQNRSREICPKCEMTVLFLLLK